MKLLFTVLLTMLLYYNFSCNSNSNTKQSVTTTANPDSQNSSKPDSLKWLFYAYTFTGKALFKNEKGSSIVNPVECEVVISLRKMENDTAIYNLKYKKDGYEFSHVYEAMNIYGFSVSNNVPSPLTGGVILDSISYPLYVTKMNNSQDSAFRVFLKIYDTAKLDTWLLSEAKKRKIF
jgi:hypothetical protein